MEQYISKNTIGAIIRKRFDEYSSSILKHYDACTEAKASELGKILTILDTIEVTDIVEVTDPYALQVQYSSVKDGIQAHAETYSFNIESELFNQLTTKEQQKLWRKEIEQAVISGGEAGVELARDPRYKENIEVKKVKEQSVSEDLEEAIDQSFIYHENHGDDFRSDKQIETAYRYGFETGVKYKEKQKLETKELNLDKKIKDYFDNQPIITRSKGIDYKLIPTGVDIAKHFFELGLKAQKGE